MEKIGKTDDEAMIFLENMYGDARSNIDSLLATAKALKPEEAKKLPFDGDALGVQSIIEAEELRSKKPQFFPDKSSRV